MKAPGVATQALLLFVVVLTVYYPAISAPLNPVDDRALIQWLHDTTGEPLLPLFTHARDVFFRPVLLATFLFDMRFWGAETSFLHLENILLHALNVLLLFASARCVYARVLPGAIWLPFLAALLFAIHPVNTEAVIWISGRSDLLSCTFMLGALLLLLHGLVKGRPLYTWSSLLMLVPGFLAKETALFFVPAALFLLYCFPAPTSVLPACDGLGRNRWTLALPFIFLPLAYLCMRGILARDAGAGLVRSFFATNQGEPFTQLWTVLTGVGFYAKKLIYPWPLNFTIFHVPEYYGWVGLLVVALLIYFLFRRNLVGGLFLGSAAITSSALLAMLLRPAWTPVAERYLYLSATFFVLAVVLTGALLASRNRVRSAVVILSILVYSSAAFATVDRAFLWQDNLRLFEDSVQKSPDFPFARSALANLLREAGRAEEGAAIIRENVAPKGLRNADFLDLQRAELLVSEGHYPEARKLIIEKRRKGGQLYSEFQKLLVNANLQMLKSLTGDAREELRVEVVMLYEELALVTHDPFYHYRLGQFLLQEGDRVNAGHSFRLAAQGAPEGSAYKEAAAKLAAKLEPQ